MLKHSIKTHPGMTSFYVVIFAALLFTIIVVGFVNIILSEAAQTINDQLSQSARDSAIAGVEDAKLAIINCISHHGDCGFLNQDPAETDCDEVARALGRVPISEEDNSGAIIEEEGSGEASAEMLQAYTCVIVNNVLSDYRSYISSSDVDSIRVVPLRAAPATADSTGKNNINSVTGVKISWYASGDSQDGIYDFRNIQGGKVHFGTTNEGFSMPPTLAVQLIQTDQTFTLNSYEIDYSTEGGQSDRGTLFLVPSNGLGVSHISATASTNSMSGAVYDTNVSTLGGFAKANDKAKTNIPYIVKCDDSGSEEFICSVTIELPTPVQHSYTDGGIRNPTTSFLVVSLPYGQPATDFAVQLCTDANGYCNTTTDFVNAQYSIDSTGRANDVYRRVETRVEIADTYFPYPQYALHLTGTGEVLKKTFWSTYASGYPWNCWVSNDGRLQSSCSVSSGQLLNAHIFD